MRRPNTFRRVLLVMLLVLTGGGALAQFNGPADSANDGVNTPHVITTDPAILYPPPRPFRLHVGDNLKFSVYGVPDYSATYRVTTEGNVVLPLLDAPVHVQDLTLAEAQSLVSRRFTEAQMFRSPEIEIDVVESPASVITLLGDLRSVVPTPTGTRRLFEVLAAGGGIPPTASHVLSIDRPGLADSINVDLGTDIERSKYANIPVFSGDTITVGHLGGFYLLGAFRVAGVQQLTNNSPLTMLQAFSVAGKQPEGKLKEVRLIRTIGTTRTVVTVNMDAVMKGRAPDPVIQPDDIIYLPSSKFIALFRNGGFTTAYGVILSIYALSR